MKRNFLCGDLETHLATAIGIIKIARTNRSTLELVLQLRLLEGYSRIQTVMANDQSVIIMGWNGLG